MARGGGWLARAQRLLDEVHHDGVERGYLLLPVAIQSFHSQDPATAHATFERAASIGVRFGDEDLTVYGRMGQGRALIRMGETADGVALLDEVMVAVTAGEVSPVYRRSRLLRSDRGLPGDLRRAPGRGVDRGADQLVRVTTRTGGVPRRVPGASSRDHAASRRMGGGGERGESGLRAACWPTGGRDGVLPAGRGAPAPRRVRRGRGRPIGRPASGDENRSRAWRCFAWPRARSTRRRWRSAGWRTKRTPRWPGPSCWVRSSRSCWPPTTSVRPASLPMSWRRSPTTSAPRCCTPCPAMPPGRFSSARAMPVRLLVVLRRALAAWRKLDAPYEAARVQVLLGLACRELGDRDAAEMELHAARSVFRQLGATPDLARVDALSPTVKTQAPMGLTGREVEVLASWRRARPTARSQPRWSSASTPWPGTYSTSWPSWASPLALRPARSPSSTIWSDRRRSQN